MRRNEAGRACQKCIVKWGHASRPRLSLAFCHRRGTTQDGAHREQLSSLHSPTRVPHGARKMECKVDDLVRIRQRHSNLGKRKNGWREKRQGPVGSNTWVHISGREWRPGGGCQVGRGKSIEKRKRIKKDRDPLIVLGNKVGARKGRPGCDLGTS